MNVCGDMMKKCCSKSTGLLLIRLSLAVIFLSHGISKLSDMDSTIAFFASLGLGAFFAWLVAIIETLGGLFMLLGMWTCVTGAALAVVMIMAIVLVKSKMGFPAMELEIVLLASSLAIAFAGAGKYSIGWCCSYCMGKNGSCGHCSNGSCSNCANGTCSVHADTK